MDIYLIRNNYGASWDEAKVADILDGLGLAEFECEMREVAEYWFGKGEATGRCLENEGYILDSGTYGTIKHSVENQIARKGRWGYFWSRAFLPYNLMVSQFQALKILPVLLPVCWVLRLLSAFIFKHDRVMYQLKAVFAVSKPEKKS